MLSMIMSPAESSKLGHSVQDAQRKRRQTIVLALSVTGLGAADIARRVGCSRRTVWYDLQAIQDERIKVDDILTDEPVNAADIHLRLSEMFDADIADIIDEATGEVKPVHAWPLVWRQGLVGEVTIEPVSERSRDGGNTSWDVIGSRVRVKRESASRLIELLGRLTSVDALVKSGSDAKGVASEVMSEIDKRIAAGRQRAAQRVPAQIETSVTVDDAERVAIHDSLAHIRKLAEQ